MTPRHLVNAILQHDHADVSGAAGNDRRQAAWVHQHTAITIKNNYLSIPPAVAAKLPRQAQELIGYAVHDGIPRGGGYLGMVRLLDPVELLSRGELT